jgi:RND superfamily putative drug exporter
VVSRLKDEIHAGLGTGIIRGIVVHRTRHLGRTSIRITMMSMIVNDLRVVGNWA